MLKNRAGVLACFLVALIAITCIPLPASAQTSPFPSVIDANGTVCPGPGFASRIVTCIEGTVKAAVANFLMPLSTAVNAIVRIIITLMVIFYGLQIMFARRQPLKQEGIINVIKIGFVTIFTWNFGNFFPAVIAIVDGLINAVGTYASVSLTLNCPFSLGAWQRVDCSLDRLIGSVMPGSTLTTGILGFLTASMFSGSLGFTIFIMGLAFVGVILLAICKSVYIYLSTIIALALMVCISPLIIPLILFRVTKGYFEKWLRLFLALMLQPIFLCTYLALLLAAFDVVIYSGPNSLYRTIAGTSSQQTGFHIGQYMSNTGAYVNRDLLSLDLTLNPRVLASGMGAGGMAQTGVFGRMQRWASDLSARNTINVANRGETAVPVYGVDYRQLARGEGSCPAANQQQGECLTIYLVRVMMSLLTALIVAYIFYVLLDIVPYLGTKLTGENGVPNMGNMMDRHLKDLGKNVFSQRGAAGAEAGGGGGR